MVAFTSRIRGGLGLAGSLASALACRAVSATGTFKFQGCDEPSSPSLNSLGFNYLPLFLLLNWGRKKSL